MTVSDLVAIIIALAGVLSALSVFYGFFILPIKRAQQGAEQNRQEIQQMQKEIASIKSQRESDNAFSGDVKSLMLESLMAILEALEHTGLDASKYTNDVKRKLFEFLSHI
ncbi:MAG: hypothetical protein FWD76_00465 [Firmicutes bacterium]|nr:hypothetical protein [Bacillota bacterium]